MKLGIFDSGLGGLLITKAIQDHMLDLDIIYLGDTLRVPYGNRSDDAIYRFSKRAMEFLFEQDCSLVVTACNTVSARSLRRLQQEFLPSQYPDRNIIGVVVPTLEAAIDHGYKSLGVIGTNSTIQSKIYSDELQKIAPDLNITQQATPLLVPLIEHEGQQWSKDILEHYLAPIKEAGSECVILGCTHYPFLKQEIQSVLGSDVKLLSQDEIIPAKLKDYLERHPEYNEQIARNGNVQFLVSDYTPSYHATAERIYGSALTIEQTEI